jgi:hypothetical protein
MPSMRPPRERNGRLRRAESEHRLNTFKNCERENFENPVYSIARMRPAKTLSRLFAIHSLFPKVEMLFRINNLLE